MIQAKMVEESFNMKKIIHNSRELLYKKQNELINQEFKDQY